MDIFGLSYFLPVAQAVDRKERAQAPRMAIIGWRFGPRVVIRFWLVFQQQQLVEQWQQFFWRRRQLWWWRQQRELVDLFLYTSSSSEDKLTHLPIRYLPLTIGDGLLLLPFLILLQ